MATPYRSSAREPRIVVTRSVGGLGWPFAVAALVLFLMAGVTVSRWNDQVRLDCLEGKEESCVVTTREGNTATVPSYAAAEVRFLTPTTKADGKYIARFGLYVSVPMRTGEDADRYVAAFRDHQSTGAAHHDVVEVGETPYVAIPIGGLGLGLLALVVLRRGRYRFIRDDNRAVLRVERASGFVDRSVVELPFGDVEEIIALSHQPDKAFARYAVVLRTRAGDEILAFPMQLNARDAFAIANSASTLLSDE